jgi:hypothetical protein
MRIYLCVRTLVHVVEPGEVYRLKKVRLILPADQLLVRLHDVKQPVTESPTRLDQINARQQCKHVNAVHTMAGQDRQTSLRRSRSRNESRPRCYRTEKVQR